MICQFKDCELRYKEKWNVSLLALSFYDDPYAGKAGVLDLLNQLSGIEHIYFEHYNRTETLAMNTKGIGHFGFFTTVALMDKYIGWIMNGKLPPSSLASKL